MAWRATLRSRGASSSPAPPLVPGRQSGFRAPPCEHPKLIYYVHRSDIGKGSFIKKWLLCVQWHSGSCGHWHGSLLPWLRMHSCKCLLNDWYLFYFLILRLTWCVRGVQKAPVSIPGWSSPALRLWQRAYSWSSTTSYPTTIPRIPMWLGLNITAQGNCQQNHCSQ